nr:lipocalin-like domain-containing protein [Shewanella donghaensis]
MMNAVTRNGLNMNKLNINKLDINRLDTKSLVTFKQIATLLFISIFMLGCTPNTIDDHSSNKTSMGNLLTQSNDVEQYAKVQPNHQLRFPEDHLSHDKFRQEWWYLTANMTTEQGENVGLQWTQFRIALSAKEPKTQEITVDNASAENSWATNQMFMSHAALTSASNHQAKERWSRAHPQLAHVSPNPLRIQLDDWQWQSESTAMFPAMLTVNTENFGYQLSLTSDAPMNLQGDNGYSIKSPNAEVASYYYSQPFIDLTGTIVRDGVSEIVTGKAWLDREWSSQFLTKAQQGWDWFSIRLDDGSALMLFQLRSSDKHGSKPFFSARRMFEDGSGRNINSKSHPNDIQITPLAWQQTDSGKYPIQWKVSIASEEIDVTVNALNPNSNMPLTISYWEGPISISGSHQGTGYMELTGY